MQLAGDDRIHAYPPRRVLHRDDSRELDHRGLGRRVADLRATGEADARGRSDVDDRPAALLLHHRKHVLAGEEHALQVESTCASQTSSDISTGPPGAEPPTLLTSTSIR